MPSANVTLVVVDKAGNMSTCITNVQVQDPNNNCNQPCTEDIINLGQIVLSGTQDFVARHVVNSESTIDATANITMKARDAVNLLPGFTALPGSTFLARIEDCTAPSSVKEELPLAENRVLPNTDLSLTTKVNLKIQPNPFRHKTTLVVDLMKAEEVSIKVYDQAGRLLKEVLKKDRLSAGRHEIPMTDEKLFGGLYYVSLQTAKTHIMKKVIVISDGGNWKGDDDD